MVTDLNSFICNIHTDKAYKIIGLHVAFSSIPSVSYPLPYCFIYSVIPYLLLPFSLFSPFMFCVLQETRLVVIFVLVATPLFLLFAMEIFILYILFNYMLGIR